MRKFQSTFNTIAQLRSMFRGKGTREVKVFIGDSTRNNRTLTVSQVIRYLNGIGVARMAETVEVVSSILEPEILKRRENRTDAIDITELVNTYRTVVMNGRSCTYRRRIGNALARVG